MEHKDSPMKTGNYKKFALMLLISFGIMYSDMFLNVDKADHVYLSITRMYMTLLMVSPMALLLLGLMKGMYRNKTWNGMIVLASISVFVLSLILLRTQTPVGDRQYLKAMIPHHSSAILTSQEAALEDPEVKSLAEEIIRSQEEEIAQMKAILERMK